MIGSLIGAGVAALGSGINAIMGARASSRRKRELAKRERDNQFWYDRRYNEVGHERADAQRLLTKMREAQADRMSRAAGANAVMGGSSARVASEQVAANKAMGDTIASIDAAQEARKDRIENQYLGRKDAIAAARDKVDAAEQANLANAASVASAIGANIAASAVGNGGGKVQTAGQKAAAQAKVGTPTGTDGMVGVSSVKGATAAVPSYNPYASVWSEPELEYSDDSLYDTTLTDTLRRGLRKQYGYG